MLYSATRSAWLRHVYHRMQGASISRTHRTLSWHEWEKKRPRPEPSAAVFGSQVVLKRLSGTGSVWKSMVCLGRPSLQQPWQNTSKYHNKKNIKQKLYILRSFKKSIEAIACNRQLIQQYLTAALVHAASPFMLESLTSYQLLSFIVRFSNDP